MSALYFVPVDHHHQRSSAAAVSPFTPFGCAPTRGFVDHDYALHPYAHSPYDALAEAHHERSRAAALHRARVARRQAELRVQAELEQVYYDQQIRLRRAHEERLLLQHRARQIEQARLLERQRRAEAARIYEARRLAAISEHQRRRLEHHSEAQSSQALEEALGQLLTTAFGHFFDFATEDSEAPSAGTQANDPSTAHKEVANTTRHKEVSDATGQNEVSSTVTPDASKDITDAHMAAFEKASTLATSPFSTPAQEPAQTEAARPASPAGSHRTDTSSRSSSRGRSRQPRVRDVDENGEEIVLPQDSEDDDSA